MAENDWEVDKVKDFVLWRKSNDIMAYDDMSDDDELYVKHRGKNFPRTKPSWLTCPFSHTVMMRRRLTNRHQRSRGKRLWCSAWIHCTNRRNLAFWEPWDWKRGMRQTETRFVGVWWQQICKVWVQSLPWYKHNHRIPSQGFCSIARFWRRGGGRGQGRCRRKGNSGSGFRCDGFRGWDGCSLSLDIFVPSLSIYRSFLCENLEDIHLYRWNVFKVFTN